MRRLVGVDVPGFICPMFTQEMHQAIVPYIDDAISSIEESGRAFMEDFIWGCLTIYGIPKKDELFGLWTSLCPDKDVSALDNFIYNTDYFLTLGVAEEGFFHYPVPNWYRFRLKMEKTGVLSRQLAPVPLSDIIEAGKTTPRNHPFGSHPEGERLRKNLDKIGHGDESGEIRLHMAWYEEQLQRNGPTYRETVIKDILEQGKGLWNKKLEDEVVSSIHDYMGAIPKWCLRGLASVDGESDDVLSLPGEESNGFRQHEGSTASYRKVGRNDPCPCGSGLKYKKCHGKNL